MTPTEAIASIRESYKAAYSPEPRCIDVLIEGYEALSRVLETAFREGYRCGWSDGVDDGSYLAKGRGEDAHWDDSNTKAILTTQSPRNENG